MLIVPFCPRNANQPPQTADLSLLNRHVSMRLKDLDTTVTLGAPHEVVARALDRLAQSLVAWRHHTGQGRGLLEQVMRLRADWRHGGHRLGRQSLEQVSARWAGLGRAAPRA